MKLKKITSSRIGDVYYCGRHPSGLTIYLYPKEGRSTSCAVFGTKYGSIDTCFQRSDEDAPQTVPEGIAHFLEHKLFESQEGSAFERYARTGANANAFTSFDSTCYLFSCTDRLCDSLEILLDFVQSPYFTTETVAKEQGIIGQEIKMYDDDPQWRVMFNFLRAMYHAHPIRQDIAGTVESIAQITPEHLYRCYDTFYNLHNMALCVTGNLDVDAVLSVCDRVLKPNPAVDVSRVFPYEPDTVAQSYTEERLDVALPLFQFGYKEPAGEKPRTERDLAAVEVLLEILASESSPLYQNLLNRGLINEVSFGCEYFCGDGYAAVLFSGESTDPRTVAEAIDGEIGRLCREGLPAEDFERAKRALYGENIAVFDSPAAIANGLLNFSFRGHELFAYIEALADLKVEDVFGKLQFLAHEKSVLSVVLPREGN